MLSSYCKNCRRPTGVVMAKKTSKWCSYYLPLINAYHYWSLEPLDIGPITHVTYQLKAEIGPGQIDFSLHTILYPTCRRFVFADYYKQKADMLKCRAESNLIMMRCFMNDFCNPMTVALLFFPILILFIVQHLILNNQQNHLKCDCFI